LVFAAALGDPAVAAHDSECPGEGSAVHRKHFAQAALGNFSGAREDLEDGELSGAQADRPKGLLVELCKSPGGSAETAAQARESWQE
jgi:hypothetical protein